jgi:hypothetical protein
MAAQNRIEIHPGPNMFEMFLSMYDWKRGIPRPVTFRAKDNSIDPADIIITSIVVRSDTHDLDFRGHFANNPRDEVFGPDYDEVSRRGWLYLDVPAGHTIAVRKRLHDYHACLNNNTKLWEAGRTRDEAIGKLILTYRDSFGIMVGDVFDSTTEILSVVAKLGSGWSYVREGALTHLVHGSWKSKGYHHIYLEHGQVRGKLGAFDEEVALV